MFRVLVIYISVWWNEMKWWFRPRFCTSKTILGRGQPGLMRWFLLWMMPLVQDRSLDLLASGPCSALPLYHGLLLTAAENVVLFASRLLLSHLPSPACFVVHGNYSCCREAELHVTACIFPSFRGTDISAILQVDNSLKEQKKTLWQHQYITGRLWCLVC